MKKVLITFFSIIIIGNFSTIFACDNPFDSDDPFSYNYSQSNNYSYLEPGVKSMAEWRQRESERLMQDQRDIRLLNVFFDSIDDHQLNARRGHVNLLSQHDIIYVWRSLNNSNTRWPNH